MADLDYIRRTMERAGAFTTLSGWGLCCIGLTALVAGWLAGSEPGSGRWLTVWMSEAGVALSIGGVTTIWKARSMGEPILPGPVRKFVLALAPALGVGATLTLAVARAGAWHLVPGLWLLLYGAGLVSGAAFTARLVPVMGGIFMVLGAAGLLGPTWAGPALLAVGFGAVHIGVGLLIARRDGS
jgi:hypothetical protein